MKLVREKVEPSVQGLTDTELLDLRQFEPVIDRLERARKDAAHSIQAVDAVRMTMLTAAERLLLPLNEPVFPLSIERWSQLQTGCMLLRRLRDLYLDLDALANAQAAAGGAPRRAADEPAESIAEVLALMRAFDAQSRLLRYVLRNRVVPEIEDWRELTRLAARARATTLQDVALPDPAAITKGNTARALLTLPLLLREARLQTLNPVERMQVDRLARQVAHKVGFRIDHSADLPTNPHGPTVVIDNALSVRLDNHALVRVLADKAARLAGGLAFGTKLPRGVTVESMRQLLVHLQGVWGPGRPPPRTTAIDTTVCSIHFGLPGGMGDRTDPAVSYDYGRYDVNTIMRVARKQRESSDAGRDWLSRFGEASCRTWCPTDGAIQAHIERTERTPLALHSLVVLRPAHGSACALQMALPEKDQLWLGRLVGMCEAPQASQLAPTRQLLSLLLWPLPGRMVGLRLNPAAIFEGVLLVPGRTGSLDEHTVLLRPGHWSPRAAAVLRLQERDLDVRLVNVIERGHQFERVRIAIEGVARS